MHHFDNVTKDTYLLQPLDGSDVIPFPPPGQVRKNGPDGKQVLGREYKGLDLTEEQVIANCRDLSCHLKSGHITASAETRELVAAALGDWRARQPKPKAPRAP